MGYLKVLASYPNQHGEVSGQQENLILNKMVEGQRGPALNIFLCLHTHSEQGCAHTNKCTHVCTDRLHARQNKARFRLIGCEYLHIGIIQ